VRRWLERGIAPHAAERVVPAPLGPARLRIDARVARGVARHLEHPLARRAVLHPQLDDLDSLQRRAGMLRRAGILRRPHRERGRTAFGSLGHVGAHRHAARVALVDQIGGVAQAGGQLPAAEEAHDDPRSTRPVGLTPAHRLEERVARVLFRPHGGQPAGIQDDAVGHRWHLGAAGRGAGRMPDELVLVDQAGRAEVRVGRADEAELERVGADA